MLRSDQTAEDSDYFDFSFSGLKTAVVQEVEAVRARGSLDAEKASVARAFQDAVIDVLVSKTLRAVEVTGCRRVLLGGGVSANGALKAEMARRLGPDGRLFHASPRLSLDNGAMVARAAAFRLEVGELATPELTAAASMPFPVGTLLTQVALRRDVAYPNQNYPASTGALTVKMGQTLVGPDQVADVRFDRLWDGLPTFVHRSPAQTPFSVPAALPTGTPWEELSTMAVATSSVGSTSGRRMVIHPVWIASAPAMKTVAHVIRRSMVER